jgi:hypothetical protein
MLRALYKLRLALLRRKVERLERRIARLRYRRDGIVRFLIYGKV